VEDRADVNYRPPKATGQHESALHWSAMKGDEGIVRFLLAKGADPNATTMPFELTPLHLASSLKHRAIAKALLDAGASGAARNRSGHTPARTAQLAGHSQFAFWLHAVQMKHAENPPGERARDEAEAGHTAFDAGVGDAADAAGVLHVSIITIYGQYS